MKNNTKIIDTTNTSAFMVHHILQKSNPLGKKKKPKSKKNKSTIKQSQPLLESLKSIQRDAAKVETPFSSTSTETNMKLIKPVKISKPKPAKIESSRDCFIDEQKKTSKFTFEKHFNDQTLLNWILNGANVQLFMKNNWEKEPMYKANIGNGFSDLLSTPTIDSILATGGVQFTKNIDITLYDDGVKELFNVEGVARPHVVWDHYIDGCSVRLLNPQAFVPNIHRLCSQLQDQFDSFVGCNAYLTPPNSQGFAPHYDDIEAFILQIEGKKKWRVYEPRCDEEVLPRYSSIDFTSDMLRKPILELTLNAGDVLYIPRGFIHQASTVESCHSLHITVSMYQRNAWIDLLEKIVPKAMETAWQNDVEFRQGLPTKYLDSFGSFRNKKNVDKTQRALVKEKVKTLIGKLTEYVNLDEGVDEMGRKFIEDALPPCLTEDEKKCTVYGNGLRMSENGVVVGATHFRFTDDVEICLLKKSCCRLMKEYVPKEGSTKKKIQYNLYYTSDNSLQYHEVQPSFLVISKKYVPFIQYLLNNYPNYVTVAEMPSIDCDLEDDNEEKVILLHDLWDRGIIRTKVPRS